MGNCPFCGEVQRCSNNCEQETPRESVRPCYSFRCEMAKGFYHPGPCLTTHFCKSCNRMRYEHAMDARDRGDRVTNRGRQ